jgi:hypothetical protein
VTLGVLAAVAAAAPNPDDIGAGVAGFLVVAAMAVALVFLLLSMNKQFRKITPKPGPGAPDDGLPDNREAGSQHVTDS